MRDMKSYYIGIDSTDSPNGGCTTWTATRIIRALSEKIKLNKVPKLFLIRLNPNVPLKTRGNAAIRIELKCNATLNQLINIIVPIVQSDHKRFDDDLEKKPGVVISTKKGSDELYNLCLTQIVKLETAISLQPVEFMWPEGSMGLIGALAAISASFSDYTYELLVYRNEDRFGSPRSILFEEVKILTRRFPSTFSSICKNRLLIAPTGPDPVLVGIRGDSPQHLVTFFEEMTLEPNLGSQIFISNQGTDAHVWKPNDQLIIHSVFSSTGIVNSKPMILPGGHVSLSIRIRENNVACMVFEPTKELARRAMDLLIGDRIIIHGAVNENQNGIFISLEYFEIIDLVTTKWTATKCTICGLTMRSKGKLSGYYCDSCDTRSFHRNLMDIDRKFYLGEKIYASMTAQRHLTRPLGRLHINHG